MREYRYKCTLDGEVEVELIVKHSKQGRFVYLEEEQIGEITGWSGRQGYKVEGADSNSNHKSVGSAANEAYYLHLISKYEGFTGEIFQ